MSYILIFGIICVALPLIAIEITAHAIFIGFMRDDDDTSSLLAFAIGLAIFGAILIAIHFLVNAAS
tara:strand:+ start:335 stop:532 length:198 start_codon:yes stop_codon:yes gene_type:complete